MNQPRFKPLTGYPARDDAACVAGAKDFLEMIRTRRTVRDFSDKPVPMEAIEAAVTAAALAPNGANRQAWHFAIVTDPAIKRAIREAAEDEERSFYGGRAPQEWLEALAPLGTNWSKPFLEKAPVLIVIFQEQWSYAPDGERQKNYYVMESVGIATGFLIAALHQAGLATLTHTPSPMGFLRDILKRPANEKAAMILVVGHPEEGAVVPDIGKKSWSEIATKI